MLIKDGRLRPVLRVAIYIAASIALFLATRDLPFVAANWPPTYNPTARIVRYLFAERVLICAIVVGVALVLRSQLDQRSLASLGLSFRAPWLALAALGFAFGAAMQSVIVALDVAFGFARLETVAATGAWLPSLALAFLFFAIASLAEEMPLRGYILQNLWEEWGFVPAAILGAVLFAALHLFNAHALDQPALTLAVLIGFGIWTAASVYWTRSLWLAFGAHLGWNVWEGPVYGSPVSGFSDVGQSILRTVVHGPAWFTGAAYGPEAGASALVALAVGFIAMCWLAQRGVFARVPDLRESYARPRRQSSEAAVV